MEGCGCDCALAVIVFNSFGIGTANSCKTADADEVDYLVVCIGIDVCSGRRVLADICISVGFGAYADFDVISGVGVGLLEEFYHLFNGILLSLRSPNGKFYGAAATAATAFF